MPTPTYDLIASNVLGSSASSVTFSSIPATYRDLVLVCNLSGTFDGQTYLRFNSDSGNNYNFVQMNGNGSTAASTSKTSQSVIEFEFPKTATSTLNLHIHQIMDYSATDKHKTSLSRTNRANGGVGATASRWASTSAINAIEVSTQAGNFETGSTFYLFGIAS